MGSENYLQQIGQSSMSTASHQVSQSKCHYSNDRKTSDKISEIATNEKRGENEIN